MQIKEVAARYENVLILSSVIIEVKSHYGDFKMHRISLDLLQLFLHHLWI